MREIRSIFKQGDGERGGEMGGFIRTWLPSGNILLLFTVVDYYLEN